MSTPNLALTILSGKDPYADQALAILQGNDPFAPKVPFRGSRGVEDALYAQAMKDRYSSGSDSRKMPNDAFSRAVAKSGYGEIADELAEQSRRRPAEADASSQKMNTQLEVATEDNKDPRKDPRMALAAYEYIWNGNLDPIRSIYTEYSTREAEERKAKQAKEEQAAQKALLDRQENDAEKKRLEDDYNDQKLVVETAEQQYEAAMKRTDDKAQDDARISLDAAVKKLDAIGKKLGLPAYTPNIVTEPDKPDKPAGGYASDTEQQKIKDYVVNEREKIAAMSRSKAKVNAMEGLNTYIGANNPKVEGGLGKLYSEIDIKNAKPLPPKKTYTPGKVYEISDSEYDKNGGYLKWEYVAPGSTPGKYKYKYKE